MQKQDGQIAHSTILARSPHAQEMLTHFGIRHAQDATRPETLEAAGVARAGSLILGSAGMANSAEVIRTARRLNPRVRVLARASYLRDVAALKDAGADNVYSGEGEIALAFIEDILDTLGATPDQIDRERARAHGELSREG
jgi:CPA2 family monovalent cation:H+ antiporter-2